MPRVHLTVISYPEAIDWRFEDVAFEARPGGRGPLERRFSRCDAPDALGVAIGHAVDGLRTVALIDFYGHGAPGLLRVGNGHLVHHARPQTYAHLQAVKRYLTPDATVRLLGCETGTEENGFTLLKTLATALGLAVFGTKRDLVPADFDAGVLRREVEELSLVPHTITAPVWP